jgi:polar amino acid transport system substrate-binding protein
MAAGCFDASETLIPMHGDRASRAFAADCSTSRKDVAMYMNRWLKTAATMLAALVVPVSLGAAGAAIAQDTGSKLEAIQQRGKLQWVTMSTIPPFAFKDDKGELVGFDIDLAKLAAKALFKDPTKIEFIQVSGEGRWPAIQSGQADVGIATIYMDRINNLNFTRPILDTRITLLVANSANIKNLAGVNSPKVTVANLNNPQMADRAKQFFPKAQTLSFDSGSAQFLAVQTGRAQALQMDSPVAEYFAAQNKGKYTVLADSLGPLFANGFYVKPGDFRWWLWMDSFARELTTGSMYTEYAEAYRKWFGKEPPAQRPYHP